MVLAVLSVTGDPVVVNPAGTGTSVVADSLRITLSFGFSVVVFRGLFVTATRSLPNTVGLSVTRGVLVVAGVVVVVVVDCVAAGVLLVVVVDFDLLSHGGRILRRAEGLLLVVVVVVVLVVVVVGAAVVVDVEVVVDFSDVALRIDSTGRRKRTERRSHFVVAGATVVLDVGFSCGEGSRRIFLRTMGLAVMLVLYVVMAAVVEEDVTVVDDRVVVVDGGVVEADGEVVGTVVVVDVVVGDVVVLGIVVVVPGVFGIGAIVVGGVVGDVVAFAFLVVCGVVELGVVVGGVAVVVRRGRGLRNFRVTLRLSPLSGATVEGPPVEGSEVFGGEDGAWPTASGTVVVCSSSGNCESLLNSFFLARLVLLSSKASSSPPPPPLPSSSSEVGWERATRRTATRDGADNLWPNRASGATGTGGGGTGRRPARSDLRMGVSLDSLVLCGVRQAARPGGGGRFLRPFTGPMRRMRMESAEGDISMSRSSTVGCCWSPERAMRARLMGRAPSGIYNGTTSVSDPRYSGSCPAASTTSERMPKSPLMSSSMAS